jgi:hypothetical protein
LIRLHVGGKCCSGCSLCDVDAPCATSMGGCSLYRRSLNGPHIPEACPHGRVGVLQVHVVDSVIDISCGDGTNTVRWLANVAVARYDRAGCKGYLLLGAAPAAAASCVATVALIVCRRVRRAGRVTHVFNPKLQLDLPLDAKIVDVFEDGDHVAVETSLGACVCACVGVCVVPVCLCVVPAWVKCSSYSHMRLVLRRGAMQVAAPSHPVRRRTGVRVTHPATAPGDDEAATPPRPPA